MRSVSLGILNPSPTHSRDYRDELGPITPGCVLDRQLLVDIGGTIVAIKSNSSSWLSQVHNRYGPFIRETGTPELMISHNDDEAGTMALHGCLSTIGSNGRSAEIAASEGTAILDGVLRTMLPPVIAPDLLVHGALLCDEGHGFLCCGVSGAGKSTMAALFPEEALCDELVRLRVGKHGVEARSLPFWRARPETVTLSAVYIIEHGTENFRVPMALTKAIKEMRRHIYWPVTHTDLMLQSFDKLTDLCGETPVFSLAFRPEKSVWTTITEGF